MGKGLKPNILLGVAGSIAAYKAADVVSALVKAGAEVTVLMTPAAAKFVSPLTLKALSGNPVGLDLHDEPEAWGVGHVTLARKADAFVIVGATADIMAKLVMGLASDFVTAAALVARCPLILAPAMHTEMWEHAATQANAAVLLERGWDFIGPVEGPLASGDWGMGRLADPLRIAEIVLKKISSASKVSALKGKKLLITAGPTREPLDPVRYLSNPSSGKMGYAIAAAALRRGASVQLVSGPSTLRPPAGAKLSRIETAEELLKSCTALFKDCEIMIAAAAVSDWRPKMKSPHKSKKGAAAETLELVANPDVVATLAAKKGKRLVIGFAAETQDLLKNAKQKLKDKHLDMIVANPVGRAGAGFESDSNEASLLKASGSTVNLKSMSKESMAERILDEIESLMAGGAV